ARFFQRIPTSFITKRIGTEEQGHDELSQGIAPVGNLPYTEVAPKPDLEKETVTMGALVNKRRRKKGPGMGPTISVLATQETLIHAKGVSDPDPLSYGKPPPAPEQDIAYTLEGKSLVAMGIGMGPTISVLATQETLIHAKGVSDPDPLSYRKPPPAPEQDIAYLPPSPLWSDHQEVYISRVSNHQLSQQVYTLQAQVTGEERIKAAFEEFKKYEDDRVSSRCAEMDARLDALSIDFYEELYPHVLTATASRRWVIGHGLRLAIMKCAESTELRQVFTDVMSAKIAKGMSAGLKHGVEHGNAKLEKLKDAPIDVIMSSLYLESDSKEDTSELIRELRPNSFQIKIPVYPEVRNPKDPWSFKEEILLEDTIAKHPYNRLAAYEGCNPSGHGFCVLALRVPKTLGGKDLDLSSFGYASSSVISVCVAVSANRMARP
nr:hypothetical protein [Tanacetum cinerariifolium]